MDLDSGCSLVHRRIEIKTDNGRKPVQAVGDRPSEAHRLNKVSRRLVIPVPLTGGRLFRVSLDFPDGFPNQRDHLIPIVKDVESLTPLLNERITVVSAD